MVRVDQPCTWNIVLQYLAVRDGEGRPALYLEYSLAVPDSERRRLGQPCTRNIVLQYLAVRGGG
jgi:hypothetical protein